MRTRPARPAFTPSIRNMETASPRRGALARPPLVFAHIDASACDRPPEIVAIGPRVAHVWAFLLDASTESGNTWRHVLSSEEKTRADRFAHTVNRDRWTVARGVLRHLLSRYCGVPPHAIAFEQGATGKPSIAGGSADRSVAFNLAHSHGRALLAVARDAPVGIDLEQERRDFDPMPLARQFFFERELEAIASVLADRQREAFFRHWVAKESVLKAQGVGLSFPLDHFHVSFDADHTIARVQSRDPQTLSPEWIVRVLSPGTGWHAAVTARGEDWDVRVMA
nr:putative 4'-phosphopantetheinyltransferase 13N [uncultured bacterium]